MYPQDTEKTSLEKSAGEITSIDNLPSYEEAAVNIGAPVEVISPLGYHVGSVSVVFLVRFISASILSRFDLCYAIEYKHDDWDGSVLHS